MLLLTKEEVKPHQDANVCYQCGKKILKKLFKSIEYWNVREHCHYRGAAHSICNLKFLVPNGTPVNGLNYDYHFIIKELAEEFEEQFRFLLENTKN